jgi:pimeloyl-ACP methyl ester carboxylesterase/DNA-binding CsgD family transcriptional regulator
MHAHWAWLQYPEWFEGLAHRFRFVHFNYRGQGMSTRGLAPDHSMADWQRDLEAVLDAAEIGSAVLMGVGHGGHIATRFALDHPSRVKALILCSAAVAMSSWPNSMMLGVSAENWDLYTHSGMPRSLSPAQLAAWERSISESQTQAEFQIAIREIFRWNLAGELPGLRTPLLVLHPAQLHSLSAEEGQRFAASVPDAQFVLIDGDIAIGDPAEGLAAIDRFIAALALSEAPPDSAMLSSAQLTPRESEILRLIARGCSNQQIADELVLSVRTVERHITNLYAKIGAHGKAEATVYALRHGLD